MHRLLLTLFLSILIASASFADDLVLSDDFEGGIGFWQTNGWGLSENFSVSPTHSFTESPDGNYPQNATLVAGTIVGANLSGYLGARLEFWAFYEIEPAFDFCRVEASMDGNFWVQLGSLTGLNPFWQFLSYDLGGFAGLPDVRLRFRFFSDPLTTYDGIYIDDLKVWGSSEDNSGPLIIHEGPEGFEGSAAAMPIYADVWDASGVFEERLHYRLDGRPFLEAELDSLVGERYYHTIPAQEAGTLVEYYFEATDASPQLHTSVSDTFAYLAGRMLIYDDGVSENILESQPGTMAAVHFSVPATGYITSALMRIYTDSSHPLDSINVYVWDDDAGLPGTVLAGPFEVFPSSTPEDPEAWTWIDLRPALLSSPGEFHIGLEFSATGTVPFMALSYDSPPVFLRSSMNPGSGFQSVDFADFHIRAVVGELTPDSLLAPQNLTGYGEDDLVHLSWSAPEGLDDLLRYEIERQGSIVGQTEYLETSYIDTLTGLPQGIYTYRVRANYSTGLSPFSDPWDYYWDSTGVQRDDPQMLPNDAKMTIFPNPTNGEFRVSFIGGLVKGKYSLALFDLLGRGVGRWEKESDCTQTVLSIQLPYTLAAGIYILEAYQGEHAPIRRKVVYLP